MLHKLIGWRNSLGKVGHLSSAVGHEIAIEASRIDDIDGLFFDCTDGPNFRSRSGMPTVLRRRQPCSRKGKKTLAFGRIANEFEANGHSMKLVFANVAAWCKGN